MVQARNHSSIWPLNRRERQHQVSSCASCAFRLSHFYGSIESTVLRKGLFVGHHAFDRSLTSCLLFCSLLLRCHTSDPCFRFHVSRSWCVVNSRLLYTAQRHAFFNRCGVLSKPAADTPLFIDRFLSHHNVLCGYFFCLQLTRSHESRATITRGRIAGAVAVRRSRG